MNRFTRILGRSTLTTVLALAAAPAASQAQEASVTTEPGLIAALGNTSVSRIRIAADITLTQDGDAFPGRQTVIPLGKALEFNTGCRLLKGKADAELWIMGSVPDRLQQYFASGIEFTKGGDITHRWDPGEIRGFFANSARLPEWWGAGASVSPVTGQANLEATDDTYGINCAVGAVVSSALAPWGGDGGHTVTLKSGYYYTSAPIWMTNSRCNLRGAPSYATRIRAFVNPNAPIGWKWSDTVNHTIYSWMRMHQFFAPTGIPADDDWDFLQTATAHVGMIYMGGLKANTSLNPIPFFIKHRTPTTFATAVYDLDLEAFPEGTLGMPMSCITNFAKADTTYLHPSLEENTVIQNIRARYFSGYGIGFNYLTEINGLTVRSFELGPVDSTLTKTAHPVYLPMHTGTCFLESGVVRGEHISNRPGAEDVNKFDIVGYMVQGLARLSECQAFDCHVGMDIIGNDGVSAVTVYNFWYDNQLPDPPVPQTWYAPTSAVVRLRSLNHHLLPCVNTSAAIFGINSGAFYPTPTYPANVMPLLFESFWTGPEPATYVDKTTSTKMVVQFCRKRDWNFITPRVIGPLTTP